MNNSPSSQPSADTAPPGSPADRMAALDLFMGETEVERVAQEIRLLRRCSDLALREAERLDRAAEARAARLDSAEARLAAAPAAVASADADTDTDTDEDVDADEDIDADAGEDGDIEADADAVESLQPSGETSLALHRLTRIVRLNILLEQKLIADFRAPKPEAAPKPRDKAVAEPSRWAKFGEGAELGRAKAAARELTRDSADADERLDREDVEALLEEFDAELASGKHDKELLKEWGNDVAQKFLKARSLKPDYRAVCARTQAEIEAVMRGVPEDAAAEADPAGQDGPAETGDLPASQSQPGDPDGAAQPPDGPRGTGPPPLLA
jgi:hypothetical protein